MNAFSCIAIACIVIAIGMLACSPATALAKSEVLSNYQAQSSSKLSVDASGTDTIQGIFGSASRVSLTSPEYSIDRMNTVESSIGTFPYSPVRENITPRNLPSFSGNNSSLAGDNADTSLILEEPVSFVRTNTGTSACERFNATKHSFALVVPTPNPSSNGALSRFIATKHSFSELKYQDDWLGNVDSGLRMLAEQPDACWVPIDSPITLRRFENGAGPNEYYGVYIDGYYCDSPWIPHVLLTPIETEGT
jgi:hypothetical protein